jgi:hypothetical protein
MPAECEVLIDEQPCGVLAIGRCSIDGLAFCNTHQAKKYGPGLMVDVSYVDMCVSCYARMNTEKVNRERQHEHRYGTTYLGQAAKQELIAAGVPLVGIRLNMVTRPRITETRKLFGGVKRTTSQQQVGIWGKGWVIGECSWHFRTYGPYGSESDSEGRFLTALIDPQSVPDDELWEMGHRHSSYILAAVGRIEGEDKYHVQYMEGRPGSRIKGLQEVAEAIHRLTGT